MPYGKQSRMKEYIKQALYALCAVALGYITVFYLRGDLLLPGLPHPSLSILKPSEPLERPIKTGADNPTSQGITGSQAEKMTLLNAKRFFALFATSNTGIVTDEKFDPAHHGFTLLSALPNIEHLYSYDEDEVFEEDDDGEEVQYVEYSPLLYARMGFLFRQNEDGTLSLFDKYGQVIYETMPGNLVLLAARDKHDHPVFMQDNKYLYFNEAARAFQPSSYDPSKDDRGLVYDYPSYFGKSDTDHIVKVYTDGTVGYAYASNPIKLIASGYQKAYAPHEGFVLLAGKNGRLSIRSVEKLHVPLFTSYSLYLPATNGAESMGYFYFDSGLMRCRLKVIHNNKTTSDEEIILTDKGAIFFLPAGYTVLSYSDGVFLLEKDGLYGYYSHTGNWITAPVYTYAKPFHEGLAVCGYRNGKKCVIDTDGTFQIPFYFDEITSCSGGILCGYAHDTGWSVLQKTKLS